MKKFSMLAAVSALAGLAVVAQAQPVQTFGRYMDITVNTTAAGGGANVTTGVSNFPLLVRLDSANAASVLSQALSGGADIRFADSAGNKLPHEIESWGATKAFVWVRVPSIAGGANTKIRLYWGRNGVTTESSGAGVFNSTNGYVAVFHMNQAPGDTLRDATPNNYKGVPVVGATAGSTAPKDTAGVIGIAKHFGGNILQTAAGALTGGAYRLETSTGGNTYNSFDYTGLDAEFTVSVWTNYSAMNPTGTFTRRRGLVTKADHGATQLDDNDPRAQWFLRPNATDRVIHFQRVAAVGYGTAPYSIVASGGLTGVLNNWNYVSYSANGAGVDDNLFRLYNATAATFRTLADEAGVHQDIDVFIGGFASNSGPSGQKSGGTHFLNGAADEVRISNVARTAGWTDLEYATQRAGATALTYGAAQNNDTSRTFIYPIRSATYLIGQAITSLTPFVKSGTVSGASSAPALPTGLSISAAGVISGTPSVPVSTAAYIITATVNATQYKDTLTLTITSGSPPNAPTGVSAAAAPSQATVSWLAATGGTGTVTGYFARATQDTTKTCSWTTGPLSCVITGLTNGTSYTFVVRATNAVGNSAFSTPSAAVIPASVPSAPTGVTAAQQSTASAQATVSWTAPASNGGLAITDYYVTAAPGGQLCYSPPVANLSCTVLGLTAGTAYTFTVVAANSAGNSPSSAPSNSVTPTGILSGFAIRMTGASKPFTFTLTQADADATDVLTMTISDVYGRTVWSKTVNPKQDHTRELVWDGRTSTGQAVSAGVYMVRIATVNGGKTSEFIRRAVEAR